MTYTHLSQDERYQISILLQIQQSVREIALKLHRHESTIRREIKRGMGLNGYAPKQAQHYSEQRALQSRNARRIDEQDWHHVEDLLRVQHSPEQIAARYNVSHESIYQYIYADPTGELVLHLRCQKQRKKRYASGRQRRGVIANRRSIQERSSAVEERTRIGHWEADTIIGKNHAGALVSVVERKSGLVLIKKVTHKSAELVSAALIEMLSPLKHMVQTITTDNGLEFAHHTLVDQALGCTTFFADPQCSWQRGTNENTNGLIRQYVPKGRMMASVDEDEVQMIQDRLNHRPRKRLGFDTPYNVFYTSLKRRALRT